MRNQVLKALTTGPRTAGALREALGIPLEGWRRFRQTTLKEMLAEEIITTVGFKKGVEYALSEDRIRVLASTTDRKAERATHAALLRGKDRRISEISRELEDTKAALARAQADLSMFIGPGHVPPEGVPLQTWTVARPSIQGYFWEVGPWKCLRLEERTEGHHRESAFIRANGKAGVRFHPDTENWMKWVAGIAKQLGLTPTGKQVRVIGFPGLSYTFLAWAEMPARNPRNLHPMDPDNAIKPILDALQSVLAGEDRETGAYVNDTQVVDLLVFRLEHEGRAPIDRRELSRQRKAARKANQKPRVKRTEAPRSPRKSTSRFKMSLTDFLARALATKPEP